MTTVKPPAAYRSGLCTHSRHDRCRGAWGTAVCDCPCHTEPEPEPEPELVALHHCPTCTCRGLP